jgi:hypothetical protein
MWKSSPTEDMMIVDRMLWFVGATPASFEYAGPCLAGTTEVQDRSARLCLSAAGACSNSLFSAPA